MFLDNDLLILYDVLSSFLYLTNMCVECNKRRWASAVDVVITRNVEQTRSHIRSLESESDGIRKCRLLIINSIRENKILYYNNHYYYIIIIQNIAHMYAHFLACVFHHTRNHNKFSLTRIRTRIRIQTQKWTQLKTQTQAYRQTSGKTLKKPQSIDHHPHGIIFSSSVIGNWQSISKVYTEKISQLFTKCSL